MHGHFIATKYWRRYPDARYMAWFREPVERLASHYHYWKRKPDRKNPTCQRLIEEDLSLEAFAALPEMRDVQARFLGEVPPERLAFVGITERYDESMDLFRRAFYTRTCRPRPSAPTPTPSVAATATSWTREVRVAVESTERIRHGAVRGRRRSLRGAAGGARGAISMSRRTLRSWKDGVAQHSGTLEDYANLAEGLLTLYETTFEERFFVAARELADAMHRPFRGRGRRLLRHCR